MLTYLLLILGFVFLVKGADFFVEGSSSVAKILKVPSLIIGLTVVAFGTSMPEASVSITAALSGQNDLAVSNVFGSNIFNLLVVVGVCAAIKPLMVQQSIVKKEFPFLILISALMFMFSIDSFIRGGGINTISRLDGFIFLGFFVLFLYSTIRSALASRKDIKLYNDEDEIKILSPIKSMIFIVVGITMIIFGGDFVVNSASQIATSFGLSQTLIGLTIVAIGTSLPELVTSIVAANKGESDIALGNVVGSCIFNILLILGSSAVIHPIIVASDSIYDMMILFAAGIITYIFAIGGRIVTRLEGIAMLLMYCGFTYYIIIR
ncbi:MAG: calcium/sodium antiporter [Lachnotalea sp.]